MRKFIFSLGLLVFLFILTTSNALSQKVTNMKPIVKEAAWFRVSPPLSEMIAANAKNDTVVKSEREVENELDFHPQIIKENLPDALSAAQRGLTPKGEVLNVIANFDGVNNMDGVAPPDTQGDIGPNYYMQCTNGHTVIKDRNGNTVKGPFKTSTFWAGSGYDNLNNGDAVILWDEHAQRWVVTQFYLPSSGDQYLLIAVSKTSDPTGQYYQYAFAYSDMPDYPKWGIWPDGYYMGANAFNNNNYAGAYVTAFDRQAMINGESNPKSVTYGPNSNLWSIFPADADVFPDNGAPCPYISDEIDKTSGNNKVYIYNFHVDWTNTNNSSFTLSNTLTVSDYGLFSSDKEAPQKGTDQKLDLLQSRIMFRPYYRKFSDHESLLMCRTVNDGGVAAVRWYEFRKSGSNWSVYQQGTYNPGDGLWRWMPSIAMNANGDIALGYSVSSSSTYPSIRIVARHADDPLGVMTTNEKEVLTGTASQTGAERWGDYSMMSVDPTDNTSFWYTTEYSSGSWNWKTRIAHFSLASACTGPSQATNFTSSNIQDTQMTIGWTRGGGDKVLVVARADGAVNSDPANGSTYTANSAFGNGDQIGSGNYVVYDGTGSSVTVTNLTPGTNYHFAVYEYYTSGDCYNSTELTGNATTTGNAPCTPCYAYGNTSYNTSTTRVIFNTIDNSSAKPTDANGNAYSDYTNISTDVAAGSSYNLTVNVNTDGNYTVKTKVWIDWNHNCDFTDPGEEYDLDSASNVSDGATVGSPLSITVPSNAYIGQIRMRVITKYGAYATPCETNFDGEVEDYTINVTESVADNQAPTAPTGLAASNVGQTSLTLSWTASTDNVGVTGYDIYKNGSFLASSTSTSYAVTGLSANTSYSFYVKAKDAAGNVSSASNSINVTTLNNADTQAPTAPTNLAYSNVTQISADLSWTASTDNVGVTGYKIYKNGSLLTTTTSTSYTATGLTAATNYSFYVKAYDDAGNVSSASNTVSFTTDNAGLTYCTSKGNDASEEWIGSFEMGSINNNSGNNNGYADYTNLSTAINRNSNISFSITPTWAGSKYNEAERIWIDYNQDGDFDDANELVFSADPSETSPITGSFTVPSSALLGTTRMRVSLKYNAVPTTCETFSYGEVEDYTVDIQDGGDVQAPTAPTNLASSNITQTSVQLSWTASTDNVGVTGYDIYKNGSLLTSTTGTSYTVTGLTAGTTYSFYVKAKDAAGNISDASNTISATTTDPNDTQAPTAPTNLASSNITSTSLSLSWTASTDNVGVTGYDIYKGGSLLNSTTGTSYNVSGLTANTTYSFYVKAKDAAGNISAASNTISVTTASGSTTYCTSKGNDVSEEWIGRVVFGTIDNNSGANGGYADFTSKSTTVAQGANETITIYPTWSGTVYAEGEAVWIDYNHDGDFDDAGEQVASIAASKTSPVSASFTIPTTASTGTTRMRVSMKYNGVPTACETFSYGEVEDYTVNIVAGSGDNQAPTAPTNLASSNVAQTTLTLCWNASTDNVAVAKYNIYQNGTLLGYVDAANTCSSISNLTPATTYQFYVTALDAAGNESSASNTISVTTLGSSVTYCSSKGTNVSYEWIDKVVFNTINNTSGANGGYGDFTNISTSVAQGNSYTISLAPGFASSSYDEGFAVWIDYNHDGDFNDAGELAFSHAKSSSAVSGSITIPTTATSGATRMRVAMVYNTTPSDPCATFTYGEVEDYTVVIGAKSSTTDNKTVSIENIKVYPNPVSGILNVDIPAEISDGAQLYIYSANGALIDNSTITSQSIKIDVSDLAAGLYNIKIISGDNIYNANFVKL